MVSALALGVVHRGLEPRSDQAKEYEICICYFSAKPSALRGKNEDWSTWNQDNASEWGDLSIRGLLFQ